MRYLTFIAISLTVLIVVGSIYLHIETKHITEELSETQKQSVSQKSSAAGASLSNEKKDVAASADVSDTPSTVSMEKGSDPQAYDWRDDRADHRHTHTHGDPWQQTQPLGENAHWSDIADPYERADAYRSALIKEFGDVSEVGALVEGALKIWTQKTMSPEERSLFFKAHVTLRPEGFETENPRTEKHHTHPQPSQSFQNLRHQFSDIEPFVAEHGLEEGLLRFSAQNPKRSLEFKRALWQTDEVQRSLEEMPEEVKRFFKEVTSLE